MSSCGRVLTMAVVLAVANLSVGQGTLDEMGAAPRKTVLQKPVYPPLAQWSRVESGVFLTVKVTAAGDPTEVEVVWGHPLLDDAAIAAVKKCRYEPLNGDAGGGPRAVIETVGFFVSDGAAAVWYASYSRNPRWASPLRAVAALRLSELLQGLRLKTKEQARVRKLLQEAQKDRDAPVAKAAEVALNALEAQPAK